MPSILDLPISSLRTIFGEPTFDRGVEYARAGRVLDVDVSNGRDGIEIEAVVSGGGPRPYYVSVRAGSGGFEVYGDCTCPIEHNCKHVVAVLIALGGSRSVRSWDDNLDRALDALTSAASPSKLGALGILVEHRVSVIGFRGESVRSITLRPVQRGRSGKWIKQGIGWSDVRYSWRTPEDHDPAQWQVIRDMASAVSHNYGRQNPDITDFGSLLWPLLRRAIAAGIEIVPGGGVASFEILSANYEPAVSLQAVDEDIAIHVELSTHEAERLEVGDSSLSFLGRPAHGVVLIDEFDPPGKRATRHVALRVAELTSLVPEAVQDLLEERATIRVPAVDRSRFMVDFLPRIRRQLVTTSPDSSIVLPDPPKPRLVGQVAWLPDHQMRLTWWWSYRFDGDDRRVPIRSHEGLRDFREPQSERDLLVRADLGSRLGTALSIVDGAPAEEEVRRGSALLAFVEDVLPRLREIDEIDIVEVGARLDYRPAVGDPEINFDLADSTENAVADWLDLSVAITVDGEGVPLGSVLAALTRGEPLLFTPSGRHLRADHPALTQLAELVAAAGDIIEQPDDQVRVGRTDLALWGELDALGVVDAQAAQWVQASQALRDLDTLPDVTPIGLKSELRAYQESGLRWLAFMWRAGLGAVLADDMGLGKTLQALALIAHARESGAEPFLVVAPTSVVGAWEQQATLHTPGLVVRTVTMSEKKRGTSIAELRRDADLVVTSYTLFRLEAAHYRAEQWGGLVLDEAHNLKNHQGRTYQEVRKLEVPFRMALTGTPFENKLMELWALLSVTAPGLYPKPAKFAEVVATPVEKHGDQVALDRFRRRIRPFLLRRTKELVAADLPPKQEQVLSVSLSAKHRRIYDTHLQRERQTVMGLIDDFDHQRIAIFRALTRLRQLSLDPGLIDQAYAGVGSAKLETLVEHLHELIGEGHRALVFSQFTSYLSKVRRRLDEEGITYDYLDGRTRNRPMVIDAFKNGNAPVFLISLKAGGVGLTLTEADYVFVLDPWWNPAVEAQAVDRAHRIGQERPVMVYRLVAEGTIEEKVMELKARKEALFGQVLDGDGLMSAEVTAADVQGLFGQ